MNLEQKKQYLLFVGILILIILIITLILIYLYDQDLFTTDLDLVKSILEYADFADAFAVRLLKKTKDPKLIKITKRYLAKDEISIKEFEKYIQQKTIP